MGESEGTETIISASQYYQGQRTEEGGGSPEASLALKGAPRPSGQWARGEVSMAGRKNKTVDRQMTRLVQDIQTPDGTGEE